MGAEAGRRLSRGSEAATSLVCPLRPPLLTFGNHCHLLCMHRWGRRFLGLQVLRGRVGNRVAGGPERGGSGYTVAGGPEGGREGSCTVGPVGCLFC